jgi:hypothetical protein
MSSYRSCVRICTECLRAKLGDIQWRNLNPSGASVSIDLSIGFYRWRQPMTWKDLFRPKWKHSEEAVRLTAMRELSDQAVLLDVALHDRSGRVREAAAERLVDPRALAEIARGRGYSSSEMKFAALKRLSEGPLLLEVALNALGDDIKLAAVEKLKDQALLVGVAQKSNCMDVRLAAAGKLADQPLAQSIYTAIAKQYSDCWRLCRPVVEKIADAALAESIYAEAAIKDSNEQVCLSLIERISDRDLLALVANKSRHSEVREVALKNCANLLVTGLTTSNQMTALQAFLSRTMPASLNDDLRRFGESKFRPAFEIALRRQVEADWLQSGTIAEVHALIAALNDTEPPSGLKYALDTLYRKLQTVAASAFQKEAAAAIRAIREESTCLHCGGDGVLKGRTIGDDAPLERDCNPTYLETSECIWCNGTGKLVKYGGHWLGLHDSLDPKASRRKT